jgi:predicted nucleotidyltransferase
MLLTHPLEVVTPTLDGDVLQVLSGADAAFTVGQLHDLIGAHSYNGVKKAILRLVEQGIVTAERVGTVTTYRLNRAHLAAAAVIELAGLRAMFLERLRDSLSQWSVPPAFAALFGSAARGDMHPSSDIDIFLVRTDRLDTASRKLRAWQADLEALQQDATAWTGNDTRVLEMTQHEVRAGLTSGDPILEEIRRDGLILLGTTGFWRSSARG